MPHSEIRAALLADLDRLRAVVVATGLFPPEMLPDLLAEALGAKPTALWLVCVTDEDVVGLCYAVPEQLTEGVWNMLALGVLPNRQGAGVGRSLVARLEKLLMDRGQRMLIADTSGTDEFRPARAFYESCGYAPVGRIPDYWAECDDKLTFCKRLP